MNVLLWIIAGVLAVAFAAAGLMKLTQPRDKLASSMGWAADVPPGMVKAIGALEVLAAIGLIGPAAVGIAPVLVPLAAVGLIALMAGAVITHARRGEYQFIIVNVILLALAAVVAWGRFGPHRFTS
jgi:uncharacterized membrane protein YphA (DoxX/SURF4 family)